MATNGQVELIITQSGTQGNRITYSSYVDKHGNAKPIISMRYAIPETPNAENWTLYSANVWRCAVTGLTSDIIRLYKSDNTDFGAKAQSITVNDRQTDSKTGTVYEIGLSSNNNWTYSGEYLYVYSMSNPAQQLYASNNFSAGSHHSICSLYT